MSSLELKVPPVLLIILTAILMWFVDLLLPGITVDPTLRYTAASLLIVLGSSIAGVMHFKNARTTINPLLPESSASLVTGGVYRVTRNPMYVGFLLVLLGWAVVLSNPGSALLTAGFIIYMNRFQIIPEERTLHRLFGDDYARYKNRVPRWFHYGVITASPKKPITIHSNKNNHQRGAHDHSNNKSHYRRRSENRATVQCLSHIL